VIAGASSPAQVIRNAQVGERTLKASDREALSRLLRDGAA
jgi:hypothetical protein